MAAGICRMQVLQYFDELCYMNGTLQDFVMTASCVSLGDPVPSNESHSGLLFPASSTRVAH